MVRRGDLWQGGPRRSAGRSGRRVRHTLGERIRVRARVHPVGLSGHADQSGLAESYGPFHGRAPVMLARGENPAREALAARLAKEFGYRRHVGQQ